MGNVVTSQGSQAPAKQTNGVQGRWSTEPHVNSEMKVDLMMKA